ncbi:MAG: hypothetical protein GAK35_04156 [Herbaspirillum frisingense]|uniref:Uncharacterized protein n=1 Tax=Herbaspirillum frisingense TaxID=92645 RepID=A0A7V8JSJ3_9BURK|nr:MAG: hypothetical protein GAK35_04156 [Herbaspirillum frisingense]
MHIHMPTGSRRHLRRSSLKRIFRIRGDSG